MFYAPGFDPYLIVFQIMCVQSLMYLDIGLWICLLTGLSGSPMHLISLRQIFSEDAVRLSAATGWVTFIAFIFNAGVGALILCAIVERAKKCLDFTATFHVMHLLFCWRYNGFPAHWEWWVANTASLVGMALFGEYLCMRRELQEIPLFGAKRDTYDPTSGEYSRVSRRPERSHSSNDIP